MRFDKKFIFICFLLLVLSGCRAVHKDITHLEKYSDVVGTKYQTQSELIIHGVTYNWPESKEIDAYRITIPPGFGGRETITRRKVPIGSVFQVTGVMKCTNCLPPHINFVIEASLDQVTTNMPIWLDDYSLTDDNGRVRMDSSKFNRK